MNQTRIERIVARLMEHWAPPPPLKLDQWADENIVLAGDPVQDCPQRGQDHPRQLRRPRKASDSRHHRSK